MTLLSINPLQPVSLGDDAGWRLVFRRRSADGTLADRAVLDISSSDYEATIEATLPEGLGGGPYRFVVEGLTANDHNKVRMKSDETPLTVELYLFWRDVNSGAASYLKNLVGMNAAPASTTPVAVLTLTRVKRQIGTRQEETELLAVEDVFARLNRRVREPIEVTDFRAAMSSIASATNVPIKVHPDSGSLTTGQGAAQGDEKTTVAEGTLFRDAVVGIARKVEDNRNKHGRSMVLIRDGELHVGQRPVPLVGSVHELDLAAGLLEVSEAGAPEIDPGAPPVIGDKPSTRRVTYTLTMKGRPDIKPGDVITFESPHPDEPAGAFGVLGALAGAFAAPLLPAMGGSAANTTAYVNSVKHTLSRTAGFVTQLAAIQIDGTGDKAWDEQPDASSAPTTSRGANKGSATSDSGVAAAEAIRGVRSALGDVKHLEIAEVRAVNAGSSGNAEPPSQTETVWEGLAATDGRGNGSRRLGIRRDRPTPVNGVPYATLFAWGKTGLVVPRYPGTRVVLGYRNGQHDDPIDLGALWTSGHGPASDPGDWWLSLPVGIAKEKRASAGSSSGSGTGSSGPDEHTGSVSNDLIDADGNRVIEVGQLTVRVGKDGLPSAGTRPKPAEADSITIEHTKGESSIIMKQDGSIEITGKEITLDAGSGTITMKAKKVDVKVSDAMEVS